MKNFFVEGFKASDFFTAGPYSDGPVNAMLNPGQAAIIANFMLQEALTHAREVYKDDSGESYDIWNQQLHDGDTHIGLVVCIKPLEKK